MPAFGKTDIIICEDAADLGRQSAAAVAAAMRRCLAAQDALVMILAAGESQNTFLPARGPLAAPFAGLGAMIGFLALPFKFLTLLVAALAHGRLL